MNTGVETRRASQYLGTPVAGFVGCLKLARGLVRFVSQIKELVEKLLRLADEEPVIHETLKRGNSSAELNGRRANDGDGA